MSEILKKLVLQEKWKKAAQKSDILLEEPTRVDPEASTRHGMTHVDKDTVVNYPEPTRLDRSTTGTKVTDGPPSDPNEPPPESSASTDRSKFSPRELKIALRAHNSWRTAAGQLEIGQLGKQFAQKLGQKLSAQTGIDEALATKIADEVMKQTLQQVEEMSEVEIDKTFPGLFDRARG